MHWVPEVYAATISECPFFAYIKMRSYRLARKSSSSSLSDCSVTELGPAKANGVVLKLWYQTAQEPHSVVFMLVTGINVKVSLTLNKAMSG